MTLKFFMPGKTISSRIRRRYACSFGFWKSGNCPRCSPSLRSRPAIAEPYSFRARQRARQSLDAGVCPASFLPRPTMPPRLRISFLNTPPECLHRAGIFGEQKHGGIPIIESFHGLSAVEPPSILPPLLRRQAGILQQSVNVGVVWLKAGLTDPSRQFWRQPYVGLYSAFLLRNHFRRPPLQSMPPFERHTQGKHSATQVQVILYLIPFHAPVSSSRQLNAH